SAPLRRCLMSCINSFYNPPPTNRSNTMGTRPFVVMRELIPLEVPRVATIDEISSGCGMFYGYKCRADQNDSEGICHTFGCPIAEPMDDEDEQWEPYMEGYHYMLQHSRFAGWQSMRTCPINTKVFLWNEANEEVSIGYKP